MRRTWFKEWGWFYMPTAWQGWFLFIMTALFCAQVFVAVDRHSHSVSDTLYGIFPYWVSGCTVLAWVASRTSRKLGS